jgi:predicted small secreted protein
MIVRLIGLALAATIGLTTAGCNTMQGLGQDIERGGEKLQEKAKR